MTNETFDKVAAAARLIPPPDRPRCKEAVHDDLRQDRALSAGCLAVGMAIMGKHFWSDGCARVSRLELAILTRRSDSTVRRAVGRLEERGHILVKRTKSSPAQNDINRYTFPALARCSRKGGVKLAPLTHDNLNQ